MPQTIKSPTFPLNEHLKAIRLSHKIMQENEYKYSVEVDPLYQCGNCVTVYIRPISSSNIVQSFLHVNMSQCIAFLEKVLVEGVKEKEEEKEEKESDDDLPF